MNKVKVYVYLKQKIHKKVSAKDGATIVFALTIFLIAALIGTSLVTISVSSVKLSGKQRKDEQAYLMASSTARLIEKEISKRTIIITKDVNSNKEIIKVVKESNPNESQNQNEESPAQGTQTEGQSAEYSESKDPISKALVNVLKGVSEQALDLNLTADADIEDYINYYAKIVIKKSAADYSFDCTYNIYQVGDATNEAKYTSTVHYYGYESEAKINVINDEDTEPQLAKEIKKCYWSLFRDERKSSTDSENG